MKLLYSAVFLLLTFFLTGCGSNTKRGKEFVRGADVSWVTQMEKAGVKFYDTAGRETECIQLMCALGMNAIRLRVWVNPADGWCDKTDLLVKARRAHALGMRLMIDFHYSDVWADPGHQTKPAAWESLSFDGLKAAVATHTADILTALKALDITPEWVQVGNETGDGMLWPDGKASENTAQYAALNNAGYDAVKAVFPETRVIVHLQGGQDKELYRRLFDGLKAHGGKWDVIGMSLYPPVDNWEAELDACIENIGEVTGRYGSDVMICETGMPWDKAAVSKTFLSALFARTEVLDKVLGIFYWEPEAYDNWNDYRLGAFDNSGTPTEALDAFR